MSKYYVMYDIPKMGMKNIRSGPYDADSIQARRDDISSYEGIGNVRVLSEREVKELLRVESDKIVNNIGFTD